VGDVGDLISTKRWPTHRQWAQNSNSVTREQYYSRKFSGKNGRATKRREGKRTSCGKNVKKPPKNTEGNRRSPGETHGGKAQSRPSGDGHCGEKKVDSGNSNISRRFPQNQPGGVGWGTMTIQKKRTEKKKKGLSHETVVLTVKNENKKT